MVYEVPTEDPFNFYDNESEATDTDDSSHDESSSPSCQYAEEKVLSDECTHAVVFKCIGSNKNKKSQAALCSASKKIENGDTVNVVLDPEPTNPEDARAIAFLCEINNEWHKMGYVVQECLEAVHTALSNKQIVSTELSWAKYVVHWSKSGPGWYAGVRVVRKGYWPKVVVHSSSKILN